MKTTSKRILKYFGLLLVFFVVLYLVGSPIMNTVVGAYNRKFYRDKLSEKESIHTVTYYVSSNGNDKANGKSPATAWRTINKINKLELNPGDSVLFEAGKTFSGNLQFDRYDLGTSKKPVTICSYGAGKAVINAGNGTGIRLTNTQGFKICDISVKGSGASVNEGSGIFVTSSLFGIRYNISYNDGRKNSYAGIEVWGACENANIYNNTVLASAAPQCKPAAFVIRPNDEMGINNLELPENILIRNNIFLAAGKMELIRAINPLPGIKMINNNYYNLNGEIRFRWKDKDYTSFNEWRSGSSQEKSGNAMVGFSVDPKITFLDSNFNGSGDNTINIPSFQLADKSPMIDAGINTPRLSGNTTKADTDINNVVVPQNALFDLGACEYPASLHHLTSNHK